MLLDMTLFNTTSSHFSSISYRCCTSASKSGIVPTFPSELLFELYIRVFVFAHLFAHSLHFVTVLLRRGRLLSCELLRAIYLILILSDPVLRRGRLRIRLLLLCLLLLLWMLGYNFLVLYYLAPFDFKQSLTIASRGGRVC